MKQPLVEALQRYLEEGVYPLHTPGHKGGRGLAEPLRSLLGPAAAAMDVSLMSELDDIHAPVSYIKEAQEAAAGLYGSDACFFAMNGTTGAIHAMVMTALDPGDKVLIPRNAHRSVSGALLLADAIPVYIQPGWLGEFALQGQVTAEQVADAFRQHPDIKAVLLTSPNYYGLAADLRAIGEVAHSQGALLLVDEAHGPHLGFHEELPPSALQCGADMAAQSTHKLLGALTQCSWLHVQKERVDLQHAADVMSLLTTTSPNYLLMASLDAARAQLAADGRNMASAALQAAGELRQALGMLPGARIPDCRDVIGQAGVVHLDRTKVILHVANWGISGIEAGEILRRAKFAVELTDPQNILFLVTYADQAAAWPGVVRRICGALEKVANAAGAADISPVVAAQKPERRGEGYSIHAVGPWPAMPLTQVARSLRTVFYGPKRSVPLAAATGTVCAESVSFYPPGIPVILPGEVFTEEVIDWCKAMKEQGLPVSGPADASLRTVRILAE